MITEWEGHQAAHAAASTEGAFRAEYSVSTATRSERAGGNWKGLVCVGGGQALDLEVAGRDPKGLTCPVRQSSCRVRWPSVETLSCAFLVPSGPPVAMDFRAVIGNWLVPSPRRVCLAHLTAEHAAALQLPYPHPTHPMDVEQLLFHPQ